MAADGHTKRRILLRSMRYSRKAQSALLVRGSSRRIMTLRFRPAYIRVINRRLSVHRCHLLCLPKENGLDLALSRKIQPGKTTNSKTRQT
jgi:hypothetical protein